MCNKTCSRTIRTRERVKHGTCNMKYVNSVCNAWYGLELKNHIDKKNTSTLKLKSNQAHKLSCGEEKA